MGFKGGSGEYIPPQRVPLTDDNFPNWFDHVPVSYKYPWNDLKVPLTKNAEVSRVRVYSRVVYTIIFASSAINNNRAIEVSCCVNMFINTDSCL